MNVNIRATMQMRPRCICQLIFSIVWWTVLLPFISPVLGRSGFWFSLQSRRHLLCHSARRGKNECRFCHPGVLPHLLAGSNSNNRRRLIPLSQLQELFSCKTCIWHKRRKSVCWLPCTTLRLLDLKSRNLNYALGSAVKSFGTGGFVRSSSFANWKQKS